MNYFEQKEYMKNLYGGADTSPKREYETLGNDKICIFRFGCLF